MIRAKGQRALAMAFALAGATGATTSYAKEAGQGAAMQPGTVFTDCTADCPQMVAIAPGTFVMGADAGEEGRPEGPVRQVTITRPFALGVLEVSNAQYARFVTDSGHVPSSDCRTLDTEKGTVAKKPEGDYRHPGLGSGDGAPQMPVVCVSWQDAQAYVQWLSEKSGKTYRLPTEAEWEYAARAGSQADYPWGESADAGCAYANMLDEDGAKGGMTAVFGGAANSPEGTVPELPHAACSDGHAGAAPVGSYAPNAFGLHDMIGNVWEWTQDCYAAPYPEAVPTDGSAYFDAANCPLRAVRGGSWISTPFRNRVSWRGRDPVDQVTWIFGMRVARDLPEAMR